MSYKNKYYIRHVNYFAIRVSYKKYKEFIDFLRENHLTWKVSVGYNDLTNTKLIFVMVDNLKIDY